MPNDTREQRLAAKLRENLRRRKEQARARSATGAVTETGNKPQSDSAAGADGGVGAPLKPDTGSDS